MSKRRSPKNRGYNNYSVCDLMPTCPTPTKVRFYTEDEALSRARFYTEEKDKPMRVYECEGHYHLTSKV